MNGPTIRKTFVLLALVGLLGTLPAIAEPPFGYFRGPEEGNAASGVVGLLGWALDDDGVAAVDILVDGVVAGRANYGRNRPLVSRLYPAFPDADAAGFGFPLDTTRYLNGLHTVQARVVSESGERQLLGALQMEFLNTTHILRPFGEIEFPNPAAELYGSCDLTTTPRRLTAVTGHTLDVGVETGDMGVGYVELLIDGSIYANSRTDCFYANTTYNRGLTNCHGLVRRDIERVYPQIPQAELSGFRFVLDIGSLIDFGYREGGHVLTIRAGDISGQVANVAEIPVSFLCDNRIGNEEGFGWVGPVRPINLTDGVARVTGWALDWEGVDRVDFLVDGRPVGSVSYPGSFQPFIASTYPGYPNSLTSGWEFFFDTTGLSDGDHDLQAILVDELGRRTLIGRRDFVVDNP
jgi:N-acetylmuramoyl-L-alanine amidase